ncbi:hypothetical protein TNCV_377881 [Trichonephila clavipes]|nr:hypothetical protein TNCV_377881 [Trichonephila clavipes]
MVVAPFNSAIQLVPEVFYRVQARTQGRLIPSAHPIVILLIHGELRNMAFGVVILEVTMREIQLVKLTQCIQEIQTLRFGWQRLNFDSLLQIYFHSSMVQFRRTLDHRNLEARLGFVIEV